MAARKKIPKKRAGTGHAPAGRPDAKAIKPDTSDEQLTEYYSEANLRKILY